MTDCADVYGGERWNVQMVRGLQRKHDVVAIAQPTADNDVTRAIAAMNVRQFWLTPLLGDDSWRLFVADGPESVAHREARDVISEWQPDVIVFSDGEPSSNLAGKEVAAAIGVPFITVAHLGDSVTAKERTMDPSIRARISAVLRAAQVVVGVSRRVADSLIAAYSADPSQMHVVLYGRPSRFFEPVDASVRAATRRSLNLSDDDVLLLTVARPHLNKQYSIQIDALTRLQSHPLHDRVRAAWAGDGPNLARLRAMLRLKQLAAVVTTCGYVADPVPLLASADAFVLPSSREGAPLAIVEAMAAGLPVIATDVDGIPELLGDTGILLPDPNHDRAATVAALHDAIVRTASDPSLRRTLGDAARSRAVANFTEDVMIERYDALIRATVNA